MNSTCDVIQPYVGVTDVGIGISDYTRGSPKTDSQKKNKKNLLEKGWRGVCVYLNKVNYACDPRACTKGDAFKAAITSWKIHQTTYNRHFSPTKPYYVVCGRQGDGPFVVVIDLDVITADKLGKVPASVRAVVEAGDAADPVKTLPEFLAEFGLPETYVVRTGSGGLHLYYVLSDGGELRNKAAKRYWRGLQVDFRGQGGLAFGEGTWWADRDMPYARLCGDEGALGAIPAWQAAWVAGDLNKTVCGVNLGDFIAGRVDVHDREVVDGTHEFIVWREAMYLLKELGYGASDVVEVFARVPGFQRGTCEAQVATYWDMEADPKRVKPRGGGVPTLAEGKPWHDAAREKWEELHGSEVRYVEELDHFVQYEGGVYARVPTKLLHKMIYEVFRQTLVPKTKGKKTVLSPVPETMANVLLFKDKMAGWYFTQVSDYDAPTRVNCRNGLLNVNTKSLEPHSADYLSLAQLPVNFMQSEQYTPAWDKIKEVYPEQLSRFEAMVQAAIFRDHAAEAMCFLVGPTHSGKGTILQVIQAIFGDLAYSFNLLDAGSSHGTAGLIGRRVVIDRDMVIGRLTDEAVGFLKDVVTGEGAREVNIKYKPQFTYKFDLFFFAATNQLPLLPNGMDRDAWFRRTVLLVLDKTQQRDAEFKDIVLDEASAVFTNIVLNEYESVIPANVDAFVRRNVKTWDDWSQPVKRAVERLFEYSKKEDDEVNTEDAADMVEAELAAVGVTIASRNELKALVTTYMKSMKVQKSYDRCRYLHCKEK